MANVNKTDILYWLKKIYEALGGSDATRELHEINKTDEIYWLRQIYNSLATKTVETDSITDMTDEQLDGLQVGDRVAKKTGTTEHLYTVTYKDAENGGICLTYLDASVVETVSYDHTESGWAYNSTDVTPILPSGDGGNDGQ